MTESRHQRRTADMCPKLFVAGVPSEVFPEAVASYLSKIVGRPVFLSTNLSNQSLKAQQNQRRRGHLVLACPDPDALQTLLRTKYVQFMGRTLTLAPFKSGSDLFAQNMLMNEKRVILKRVPAYITEARLTEILEFTYGPLETIFQFKPVNPMDTTNLKGEQKPRYSVFSVVFKEAVDARQLIEIGCLQLKNGYRVRVEKFEKPAEPTTRKTAPAQNWNFPSKCKNEHLNEFARKQHECERLFQINEFEKPIAKRYFQTYEETGNAYPYDHNPNNLRLNRIRSQRRRNMETYLTTIVQNGHSSTSDSSLGKQQQNIPSENKLSY